MAIFQFGQDSSEEAVGFYFYLARGCYIDLYVWIREMSAVVETEMFAISGF